MAKQKAQFSFFDNKDKKVVSAEVFMDCHYLSFRVYFDFSIVFCLYLKAL